MKNKVSKIRALNRDGFTLIELLIAMTIFMMFITVLFNSFVGIIRAQRDANDYRILYSEASSVMESLIEEFREGMVDYGDAPCVSVNSDVSGFGIPIVYKDGITKEKIVFVPKTDEPSSFGYIKIVNLDDVKERVLNSSDISVEEFEIYPYPYMDPYNIDNVSNNSLQFQSKVTIIAKFSRTRTDGKTFSFPFRTTVSSRIYNQVYPVICEN